MKSERQVNTRIMDVGEAERWRPSPPVMRRRVKIRKVVGAWKRGKAVGRMLERVWRGRMGMRRMKGMERKARIWWADLKSLDCWGIY